MVSIVGSKHPLIRFYMATLPSKMKAELSGSVRYLDVKPGRYGRGSYNPRTMTITTDNSPNLWYLFEVLGHELGHSMKVAERCTSDLRPGIDEERVCDGFSEFLLYGRGELSGALRRDFGERNSEVLTALHRQIERYDALIVGEKGYNKEKRHLERRIAGRAEARPLEELALSI